MGRERKMADQPSRLPEQYSQGQGRINQVFWCRCNRLCIWKGPGAGSHGERSWKEKVNRTRVSLIPAGMYKNIDRRMCQQGTNTEY